MDKLIFLKPLIRKYLIKNQSGILTLEFLIATTILVMVFSAVITIVFGSQSVILDAQNNSEALHKAQQMLEEQQALARKDFKLVNPVAEFIDGVYRKKIDVETLSDHLTKKVTATVSWSAQGNRNLNIRLTAIVANFDNAIGQETCHSEMLGDWTQVSVKNTITNFADLVGDSEGSYPITGVDAHNGRLYVTSSDSSSNKENFFVFDVSSDPANPQLISKVDNDPTEGVNSGLAGVVVNGRYAYVASASGVSRGQLQIFDLNDISTPLATYHIPGVTGTQGVGNAIAYKDGFIYLGLKSTGGNGSEFHVIDVHTASNPVEIGRWPSTSLGNDINAVYLRNKYIYLATPNSQELKVIDVHDPANPTLVGSFDAPGGSGNGKSIYTVGDNLYLGRTLGGNELYVLNSATPTTTLPALGSYDLGSESVNGLIVRDSVAFALTNNQLHMLNIEDPANISEFASALTLPGALTTGGSDLDCEGNTLFAGTNANGGLYVISP